MSPASPPSLQPHPHTASPPRRLGPVAAATLADAESFCRWQHGPVVKLPCGFKGAPPGGAGPLPPEALPSTVTAQAGAVTVPKGLSERLPGFERRSGLCRSRGRHSSGDLRALGPREEPEAGSPCYPAQGAKRSLTFLASPPPVAPQPSPGTVHSTQLCLGASPRAAGNREAPTSWSDSPWMGGQPCLLEARSDGRGAGPAPSPEAEGPGPGSGPAWAPNYLCMWGLCAWQRLCPLQHGQERPPHLRTVWTPRDCRPGCWVLSRQQRAPGLGWSPGGSFSWALTAAPRHQTAQGPRRGYCRNTGAWARGLGACRASPPAAPSGSQFLPTAAAPCAPQALTLLSTGCQRQARLGEAGARFTQVDPCLPPLPRCRRASQPRLHNTSTRRGLPPSARTPSTRAPSHTKSSPPLGAWLPWTASQECPSEARERLSPALSERVGLAGRPAGSRPTGTVTQARRSLP